MRSLKAGKLICTYTEKVVMPPYKAFAVTGINHGSFYYAINAMQAAKQFKAEFNNEKLICIKDCITGMLYYTKKYRNLRFL